MRAQASGKVARRIGLLALLIAIGATLVTAASAQYIGPGGGPGSLACESSGYMDFSKGGRVDAGPCTSAQTGFWAYAAGGCAAGESYTAEVDNSSGQVFRRSFCSDGNWQFSTPIASTNQLRVSHMWVYGGTSWAMEMYKW
jgi:hypothetical protein